jgi:hypothetical protein
VHRSKVAPPGTRVPLLVFLVALAAGGLIFLQVHRSHEAAEQRGSRSTVASPAHDATAH